MHFHSLFPTTLCYKNYGIWYKNQARAINNKYIYSEIKTTGTKSTKTIMSNRMQNIVFALLMVCSTAFSQTTRFEELKSQAKAQNKHVLLYFSGSDWCAPCIKFKDKFIETSNFKAFAEQRILVYNADFPRKKANQLSDQIISDNEHLADRYNPTGNFPMIVLINSSGKVLKKWDHLPGVSVDEFIKELE
jgi:thioredoxin-related protein